MSFSETLHMLYMYVYIYILYIYIYIYIIYILYLYLRRKYWIICYIYQIITLYIYDIYSMYIFMYLCVPCIMVAFKQPRVFYGKTNICGNCNIKQKYYMQGERGGGGQIQIYGLTSPSFLSYFKYLEEKILFCSYFGSNHLDLF